MKNLYVLLCLLTAFRGLGQAPVSETIHVNSIEAKVWSNGAFFGYNNERSFKIPVSEEEDSVTQTVFRRVAPWLGAYDDFGNLKVSAVKATGIKSDFAAGIPNIEGYNGFWKVTKAQIQAHWQDFIDNGVVDNPDDAILQWPGTRMIPVESNVSEPLMSAKLAPFYDYNSNNIYDPLNGDYPIPILRGCHLPGIPDEIIFFTFHDNTVHQASNSHPLHMQMLCTLWAYACPEDPLLNNSIFVSVDYWNRGPDPLDSLYIGMYMDFEIGADDDDFIGCTPEEQVFFGYNGDSIDEGGFEQNVPLIGMFRYAVNELLDWSDLPWPQENNYFMRIGEGTEQPPTAYPFSPQSYYSYLSGHWTDGTPLRSGGNGYHPLDTSPAVYHIYPDIPNDSTGWSEPGAGNTPGHRRALASFKYPRMSVQERQRANYCFTWLRHPDSTYALSWAIEQLAYRKRAINVLIGLESTPAIEPPPCLEWFEEPVNTSSVKARAIFISPNPASDYLKVSAITEWISRLAVTDISGQICFQTGPVMKSEVSINLSLPPGLYFLTVDLENNTRIVRKIIITP